MEKGIPGQFSTLVITMAGHWFSLVRAAVHPVEVLGLVQALATVLPTSVLHVHTPQLTLHPLLPGWFTFIPQP